MPSVIVAGGGLAGLAAAAALGSAGFEVDLFEARGFLGGRATSFPLSPSEPGSELIDNCQHILLRCCVNLLDFYQRLGVQNLITFYRKFYFLEPGGRVSILERGLFPAPLHFAGSFLALKCLGWTDKVAIGRGLLALRRQYPTRGDLDRITMLDWLREQRQPTRAIERFWRQVLVSAVNEDLERMAARHGFQVFWLGFLARPDSYEMGVPSVPLGELYGLEAWRRLGQVRIHPRASIEAIGPEGFRIGGECRTADYSISALPLDRLAALAPELGLDSSWYEHSPITGIHLWFDRPVTDLPHATLLDRTIQWMFNKQGGRYLQLVVSASRSLAEVGRQEVIALAVQELAEFFPAVREAKLEKAHVIKELRATFSATPAAEPNRPGPVTRWGNFFLAGDWTRSGWPATMEGAVRSGYRAAEEVARAAGRPTRFLLPDVS
ncbi:MAG: FAD-dependent oxidoreductase [Acidobacteria bacterium]|nr:FAD-dependent oxidoreductase [Acidobacteriota bacterium]